MECARRSATQREEGKRMAENAEVLRAGDNTESINPDMAWQRRGRTFLLEPRPRRVRFQFAGAWIADTENPWFYQEWRDPEELVEERKKNSYWMSMPFWYYIPREDVRTEHLVEAGYGHSDSRIGRQRLYRLKAGDAITDTPAAWDWVDLTERGRVLDGLIAFDCKHYGTYYEEEEALPFGPRDMYHAIEVLESSRHVRVVAGNVELANTTRPRLMFETGLPVRYYIPRQDVRMDLLENVEGLESCCPWKGQCRYLNVRGDDKVDNSIWIYEQPLPGAEKIAHCVSFWQEKGFDIYVDGKLLPTPKNPFPKSPLTFSWFK
jgi:uncharacterized protein (DUF427 family)